MLYMRKDPIPFFSRSRNAPIFFNLFFLRLLYVLHFFFSTITASSSSWSLAMFLQRFCYFLLISLFILLLRLFTYSACVCVCEWVWFGLRTFQTLFHSNDVFTYIISQLCKLLFNFNVIFIVVHFDEGFLSLSSYRIGLFYANFV